MIDGRNALDSILAMKDHAKTLKDKNYDKLIEILKKIPVLSESMIYENFVLQ